MGYLKDGAMAYVMNDLGVLLLIVFCLLVGSVLTYSVRRLDR